ncbi:MAG: hypothetical protein KBS41_01410 [Oscillospiraceae bacterium]|nr:hypothetical protein [Candidatus Equicaccousia limihippi]
MTVKNIRNLLAALLCALMTVCLCSCSGLGLSEDDLLTPPKPTGDLYKVQMALDRYVEGEYKLKFPTSGKYRSAFVPCDLDNNGDNESCLAFYSTVGVDASQIMHLNLICRDTNGWQSRSDAVIEASGIEKLEFADISGTGNFEVAVGYTVFSAVDKQMVVYTLKDGKLTERFKESYNKFTVCDLDGDGASEITVISLDTVALTSKATVYSVKDDTVTEKGGIALDPAVSQYEEPVVSALPDGTPALFIDGAKGNGMITELIYLENGKPVNPFIDKTSGQNTVTKRNSTLSSMDIDGNGCLDIPVLDTPVKTVNGGETVYLTKFINWDKHKITTVSETLVNYVDGYYLRVTAEFMSRLSLDRRPDENTRVFYLLNKDGAAVKEVFRIMAVELKNYDAAANSGFFELGRSADKVYLATVSGALDKEQTGDPNFVDLTVTKEQLSDMFSLISN